MIELPRHGYVQHRNERFIAEQLQGVAYVVGGVRTAGGGCECGRLLS